MLPVFRGLLLAFLVLFAMPLGVHSAIHWKQDWGVSWRTADWSSAGLLPAAADAPDAVVRIYSARAARWRGIVASHSWIVVKEHGAPAYERWDKEGWGSPIRVNDHIPDGRWFGHEPSVVFAANGETAERLIPKIRAAIAAYPFADYGDYRAWPGPNSNTFVAWVMTHVPEIRTALPCTALGKDYPFAGRWLAPTPSRTGFRVSLGGYAGVTVGWFEGIEINILGAVVGLDIRRPGIKLPGFGRIGV